MMISINEQQLDKLIAAKNIADVDLTSVNLKDKNFSGCTLTNVIFSKEDIPKEYKKLNFGNATLKGVIFEGATLTNIVFDNAFMEDCSFDGDNTLQPKISKVSFAKAVMNRCRFKSSVINWSDFRYAEIMNSTFENAKIEYCDFYRAHFHKINIFSKSLIGNSSLNYTLFEGTTIRKDNIASEKILQENRENYEKFLVEWKENGPGIRQTNTNKQWEPENLKEKLDEMHEHAENIYKNLNGIWVSNGFLGDANWAYVKAKKIERERLKVDKKQADKTKIKSKIWCKIQWNRFCGFAFGYGESLGRILGTYLLIIIICGLILNYTVPLNSFINSFKCSFLNMIAQTPAEIKESKKLVVNILNIVQSSLGILLTGIFGFVIANKIRHQ